MESLKQKLSPEIYMSLINANIKTLSAITSHSKMDLVQMTKLDLNCVEQIFKECSLAILKGKHNSANNLKCWQRISTGCKSIDEILRGGIPLNGITEIVGCSGVGKTQICLHLSLMTQLPAQLGGLEKSVVYLCTEDVFPAKRLRELSAVFSEKYKDFVTNSFEDNVFIEHIAEVEQFKKCLSIRLPKLLLVKNVGLIVVDSIAGIFRSENLDVNYANRSQDFISIAVKLNKLSEKHNFSVVCVNQVTDNVATGVTEPCLGLAWSNIIACRLNINRNFDSQVREVEVVFAPDLPRKSCKFKITGEGLVDFE